MNKLYVDALTVQIGSAELPLASLRFVLSLYGEISGVRNSYALSSTIALQAPLDSARRKLSSSSQTLIPISVIRSGKTGKISRLDIATEELLAY